ncbi:MAG: peptidoglycan editing factor PgeF [Desulfamplus sp.]|nr:peptidoglycan editing factor PgeF [Desulfamplus sp.]MBF0390668.1 peptidoglycan editing factor PgeF [Desulfamplus sp.]
MILNSFSDGVKYYSFNNLAKFSTNLVHGVFTRHGGVSDLNFKSLNVGLLVGDDKNSVYLNREIVAKSMGVDKERSIYLNQVHGEDFLVLKMGDHNLNSDIKVQSPKEADGIITNIKGVLAVMQVADCQAVILYDPVNQVVANIHSGWRGSILNIAGRGVDIMAKEFGSDPAQIVAAISPSLGPCCAEFKNYQNEIPEHLWRYKIELKDGSTDESNHFDFWKMSHDQLTDKGLLSQNIEIAKVCTSCTTNLFYSYRKEGITGRFAVAAAVIS